MSSIQNGITSIYKSVIMLIVSVLIVENMSILHSKTINVKSKEQKRVV
jgi:hypothetical protein